MTNQNHAFTRASLAPSVQPFWDRAAALGIGKFLGACAGPAATAPTARPSDYEFMADIAKRTKHVQAQTTPVASKRESTAEIWARKMPGLCGVKGRPAPDKKVQPVAVEAPKAIPDRSKTERVWARQFLR